MELHGGPHFRLDVVEAVFFLACFFLAVMPLEEVVFLEADLAAALRLGLIPKARSQLSE